MAGFQDCRWLRLFGRRFAEAAACLALGWWLGSAGAGLLLRTKATSEEPTANGSAKSERLGSPAAPAGSTIPLTTTTDSASSTGPRELYSDWVEVPATFVTESEGGSILGLNAQTPVDAQKKTALLKKLLRLTPREHERLAEVLCRTLAEWARLQIVGLRRDDEFPENWRLAGEAGRLESLGQRFQAELMHAIGAEKAGLFKALTYQDMQRLFYPSEITATLDSDDNLSLHSELRTGARVIFFGHDHFGEAGIIAAEIKRLQAQQTLLPPAFPETKP